MVTFGVRHLLNTLSNNVERGDILSTDFSTTSICQAGTKHKRIEKECCPHFGHLNEPCKMLLGLLRIWGGKFVAKGLAYDVTSCFILKAKKAHQDKTSGNYRKDIVYDE